MNRNENDCGAALIHVAAALLALMAFSTFVMDYGVYWSARRQSQNAADAAAHAGAVALGFDSTDTTTSGPAVLSAQAEAQRNLVFGQQASVNPATDITFPTCPDGLGTCIRVDVYRTAARGNALPMFFGRFVSSSLIAQDVRATATAEVGTADTTSCLRPFGIPDKWSGPGWHLRSRRGHVHSAESARRHWLQPRQRPLRRGAVEGRFVGPQFRLVPVAGCRLRRQRCQGTDRKVRRHRQLDDWQWDHAHSER